VVDSEHILPTIIKHVLVAANAALLDFMGYPEFHSLLLNHPVCDAWPRHQLTSRNDFTMILEDIMLLDAGKDVPFDDHSLYITMSM
jgi:hypothetical protein